MQSITYVRTFADLLARADASSPSPRFANGAAPPARRWQNPREPDATEEAYFNSDDDTTTPTPQQPVKILNGSPPTSATTPTKPLVDYDSDEENTVVAEPPKKRKAEDDDDEDDVLGGMAKGLTRKRSFSGAVGADKQGPAKKMAIKVQVKAEEPKGAET